MQEIFQAIHNAGGTPYFVGGYVRDKFLGLPSKDIDIEVFHMDVDSLVSILQLFGKVDQVGRSFGVVKLNFKGEDYDFSLPRIDSKVGDGHKGFEITTDPIISPIVAASRRDFTFNAISEDCLSGDWFDFFGGRKDLCNGILRHVSNAFSEDPLRVLRGMQFAARFSLEAAGETILLCQHMKDSFQELPKERIWTEFQKLFLKGVKPSLGMKFLRDSNWIDNLPELQNLIGCPQNPIWHPEGDVWEHTLHVMDAAAEICQRENIVGVEREIVMAGAMCHDLGKVTTTTEDLKSPGHDVAGIEPTMALLDRIGFPISNRAKVAFIVEKHMVHCSIQEPTAKMVRRLKRQCQDNGISLELLGHVIEADHSGRPPLEKGMPMTFREILNLSNEMPERIEPLVMGRHLLELGWTAGPEMGDELKRLFQMQLDGEFSDLEGGLKYARLPEKEELINAKNCIDIAKRIVASQDEFAMEHRAAAWTVVRDLCIQLGMDEDGKAGLPTVVDFILKIHDD